MIRQCRNWRKLLIFMLWNDLKFYQQWHVNLCFRIYITKDYLKFKFFILYWIFNWNTYVWMVDDTLIKSMYATKRRRRTVKRYVSSTGQTSETKLCTQDLPLWFCMIVTILIPLGSLFSFTLDQLLLVRTLLSV